MEKTYSDFMNEITSDELYNRLVKWGLFSEKLPPVFDMSSFFAYCTSPEKKVFNGKWHAYVSYNSMRNINVPRPIGIPTPMGHEILCACLRDHWDKLKEYFTNVTQNQKHIVSRIHIRKMYDTNALFKMNYKNWRIDGTPEPDIFIGKQYMVCADISKCFPSIYTHTIPWALVGKKTAKDSIKDKEAWYNKIDRKAQCAKNGETHGILIGPHTSNILSEIILCKIDEKLCEKWEYIRNVDDYCCYVKNREEADDFLVDLNKYLNEYDLSLNHKKTKIFELPVGTIEQWVRIIKNKSIYFEKFHNYVDYKEVQSFFDCVVELVYKNNENVSIVLYALKILNNYRLTKNAQLYVSKTIISLALIYPYIVTILGENIFDIYDCEASFVEKSINLIYEKYMPKRYYEACSYALFYACKYDLSINNFDVEKVIGTQDCILNLMALIYCRKKNYTNLLKKLKNYALELKKSNEIDQYWLFVYECLSVGHLNEEWRKLKRANVTFLKSQYQ